MADEEDRKSLSDAPEFTGEDSPEPAEGTKATDGTPDNVRTLRQQVDAEHAKEQAKMDAEDGKSMEERAAEQEAQKLAEEKDGQFAFIVEEHGKTVKWGDLIKRNTPIEYQYKLSGKGIPNVKGGLIDPYAPSHLLILDAVVDSIVPQYIRTGEGTVEKVILYVNLKPRVVQQAFSEAGQVMLAEGAKAAQAA